MFNKIKIKFIVFFLLVVGTIMLSSCKKDIDPEPEPPEISIASPINGVTVSNIISVSGTASDNVNVVQVKFGEGDFIEAVGTTTWTIDVDTRLYKDGQTEIIAKATSDTWDVVQTTSSVKVENIDPLVGTWDWVSGNTGYGFIIFHPGGIFDESNGNLTSGWSSGWVKSNESTIVIIMSNANNYTMSTTFTDEDNTLTLSWVRSSNYTAVYSRR